MSRIGGRLGGGTPVLGPKLPCWPAGGQVEAKNGLKIGQNRPKTGLFPGYSQNTPKIRQKMLVLPLGHICAGQRRRAHCRWPSLETKVGCTPLFRGVLTPRIAVYSASRMQGKQGKRPRRVAPQGWPRRAGPAGQQLFSLPGHAVLV